MNTVSLPVAGGLPVEAFFPMVDDVLRVEVGSLAPNAFGRLAPVVEVFARGVDVRGLAFVCYYTAEGPTSRISHAIKAGRLVRTVALCGRFDSATLDGFERELCAAQGVRS